MEFDIKGKTVLEIGAGRGRWTAMLEDGNVVTPTDIKDFGLPGFIYANAENLPFLSHTFDVVFGGDVLHHLDIWKAAKEISRVMRWDGHYYGVEPNGRWWYFWTYLFQRGKYDKGEKPIFPKDIKEAFAAAGMRADIRFSMERLPLLRGRLKTRSSRASYMTIEAVKNG